MTTDKLDPALVTQADRAPESAAWEWMDSKFIGPEDHDYSADEMVDAFIAGVEYARRRIAPIRSLNIDDLVKETGE